MRIRNKCIPNMKAKFWASRLTDEVMGNKSIKLPGKKSFKNQVNTEEMRKIPPIQKTEFEEMAVTGSDVESLFPSLTDIESDRIAIHSILKSKLRFENVDYLKALKYLMIVGGKELLEEAGLGRLLPT